MKSNERTPPFLRFVIKTSVFRFRAINEPKSMDWIQPSVSTEINLTWFKKSE